MHKRTIRKAVVMAEPDENLIGSHLLEINSRRRRAGERKYSFNSFALDAFKEKIARDQEVKV